MAEGTDLKSAQCEFESHREHMTVNMDWALLHSVGQSMDVHYKEEFTIGEKQWLVDVARNGKFTYVAEPTPVVREVLESVFGPLDYGIPYV